MATPIQFYRDFQSLMRQHGIRHVLTSGMACVEYGIQQNTKDTDWIIHPDDLEQLIAMLGECERGLTGSNWVISYRSLFGAPLLKEYHQGGWTSHLVIRDVPLAPEHHLDFFGKAPRLKDNEWLAQSGGIASKSVVARMKKTDRAKDWPIVNGLAVQECLEGDLDGLLHLREVSLLRPFWIELDHSTRQQFSEIRPLLRNLSTCDDTRLERLLMIERSIWENVNRERYSVYQHEWKEFYRRWQKDQVGQWPSSEPYVQQHQRVSKAVVEFQLPAMPLAPPERKQAIFNQGIQRASMLMAATPGELEAVLFPMEVILP
jgi:hypothetical protein